jgi:Ca2+-binding RTX toxin-like protein
MATLRSYSAVIEQVTFAQAAVTRYRFNEGAGTTVLDSLAALDGDYQAGAEPGAAGSIGDGAARFDGSTGFVLVETLSGTVRIATLGDSLADPDNAFQPPGQSFADDLPAALEARNLIVDYFDHAVSGNRTDQGLARVDEVIADNPDVVILELGTNDAIQDRSIPLVVEDLRDIITALRAEDIQVLVTGAFGFYPERSGGSGYDDAGNRDDFEAIFANLVTELDDPGVVLLNDVDGSDKFLGGARIAGTPDTISGGVLASGDPQDLNDDGLHANPAGIDVIVPRVAPQTIALGAAAGVVDEPLLLANGTFEFWFTADSVSGDHALVAKKSAGHGTGGQFAILIGGGGRAVFALGGELANFAAQSAPGAVAANEPAHLVATFGAGGMHLFVDGVKVATNAYTGGLDAGLGNFELLAIGADTGASTPGTANALVSFFDGVIDEFAVYDRALTAGEVQQLFAAGERGSTVVGTAQSDTLIGGIDDEDLRGGGRNDRIEGNGGDDVLRGGGGDDDLLGAAGNDRLLGGGGGDDLRGGPGNDALNGMGGHDLLVGGSGDDLLEGGGGKDTLSGSSGPDELLGGRSIDALSGGAGEDLLNGGPGRDRLTGGPDSDTFQIDRISHGFDKIRDFEDGPDGDVLDLSAVLSFGGADEVDDFVRLSETGNSTRVEVNADGAGNDFTAVFNLLNVIGLDVATLVADGNVQLSPPDS